MKCAFFSVQHDWEEGLRNKDDVVWLGYKKSEAKTQFVDIIAARMYRGYEGSIPCSDPAFEASVKNERMLAIKHASGDVALFCSASSTLESIHRKSIISVDVSEGGLGASSSTDDKLLVWDLTNGSVRRTLQGHYAEVGVCRFFPSGLVLLSGGMDTLVKIWSIESGSCVRTLKGHIQAITGLSIIDRGRNIASVSKDGMAKLWDCGSAECIATCSAGAGQLNGVCVGGGKPHESGTAFDGRVLLSASEAGKLTCFCLNDQLKIFEFVCSRSASVESCCLLNESTAVAGTSSGELFHVDLRNASKPLLHLETNRGGILALKPWQNGYLASSSDGTCFYTKASTPVPAISASIELTGSDCDAIYDIATLKDRSIFTCCRDGIIRRYNLPLDVW